MQKVTLKKEMETLLITLYSKARMSQSGQIMTDRKAEEVIGQIDYDFDRLAVNTKTQVFMALRSAIIDDYAAQFLQAHPTAVVLHLGCGLDFRAQRINRRQSSWYDLDYPAVIELKKQFCTEENSFHLIASSVTEPSWLADIAETEQPVLVIAEGLTMYLSANEIDALLTAISRKFAKVSFVFDVYSLLSVRLSRMRLNGLLNRTGAEIKWGIDSPKELERLGLRYTGCLYLNDKRFVDTLRSSYFRSMFRMTMGSRTVNNAIRILMYEKE